MATVLTDTARALFTNALAGTTFTSPSHIGWGTGATGAVRSATTLSTENGSRAALTTEERFQTTSANDSYRAKATLTAGGALTITNAGLFDAATTGNLFVLGDFTGVVLATNDAIEFTFEIVFS